MQRVGGAVLGAARVARPLQSSARVSKSPIFRTSSSRPTTLIARSIVPSRVYIPAIVRLTDYFYRVTNRPFRVTIREGKKRESLENNHKLARFLKLLRLTGKQMRVC